MGDAHIAKSSLRAAGHAGSICVTDPGYETQILLSRADGRHKGEQAGKFFTWTALLPGPKQASARYDSRFLPGEFQRVVVPIAAVLETDYGQLVTRLEVGVHPYAAGVDSADHSVRAAEIPRPHA